MNAAYWGWVAWFVTAFVTFLAFEIHEYPKHRTLSEFAWWLMGIGENLTWGHRFARIGILVPIIWLLIHFATGGFW